MLFRVLALMPIFVLVLLSNAKAHHPGVDLDEAMGSKEQYFQLIDEPAPSFSLADVNGDPVALEDFSEKIVIIQFIYTSCPDVCPLHADKIAEVQEMVNRTPMKDTIQFISITTDPKHDGPDVLRAYGRDHGLKPVNWTFLTARSDQDEDSTRQLAETYGHKFMKTDGGFQSHGVVTHVIDYEGRWAANFHGLRFKSVNLVLYLNGLVNSRYGPSKEPDTSWWERIKSIF